MATYLIKSVQTQRLVTTLGNEEAGDPVNTYFGSTVGNCLYPQLA
jgi:hypothetical protein